MHLSTVLHVLNVFINTLKMEILSFELYRLVTPHFNIILH